jgi:peptidyl-prolyl cis-trans isomerase A (cyclophilin A)
MKTLLALSLSLLIAGSCLAANSESSSSKKEDALKKITTKKNGALKDAPVEARSSDPVAVIKTSMGDITVKLFKDKAPKTVDNFIGLASGKKEWTHPGTQKAMKDKPLYDGTVFHRVIPDFMIQAGDPLGKGIGGPGYKFADEFNDTDAFDRPGILAMANSGPGTNGSQFFITTVPTPWLNKRHTIFGEVTDGMDVVLKISKAETAEMNRPKIEIKINSISIK